MTDKTDNFKDFVCSMMTAYRWIPLLACLANKKTSDDVRMIAWLDLVKLVEGSGMDRIKTQLYKNGLRRFIKENAAWINYTMADFSYYANRCIPDDGVQKSLEQYRMDLYHDRMQDQFDFLEWEREAFKETGFEGCGELEILDLGCGTFPYIELFRLSNTNGPMSSLSRYTGVDKRKISSERLDELHENYSSDDMTVKFFISDAFNDVPNQFDSKALDYLEAATPNILFLGESLHCVDTPKLILAKLIKLFPSIQRISILEPNLDSMIGLSQAFPFHMKLHANGLFVNSKTLSCLATNLGFNVQVVKASSQHTMYHLTRI